MVNKSRALYIFKYLWDHTNEEHPATTADIIAYLASLGISTTRKTVAEDAAELQNSGFDVVCNRSRQNEYFIGTRHLELAELKLLADAYAKAIIIALDGLKRKPTEPVTPEKPANPESTTGANPSADSSADASRPQAPEIPQTGVNDAQVAGAAFVILLSLLALYSKRREKTNF